MRQLLLVCPVGKSEESTGSPRITIKNEGLIFCGLLDPMSPGIFIQRRDELWIIFGLLSHQ